MDPLRFFFDDEDDVDVGSPSGDGALFLRARLASLASFLFRLLLFFVDVDEEATCSSEWSASSCESDEDEDEGLRWMREWR